MSRLVFDARFYGTQVKGLGRYTQELLNHLAQLDHDFDVHVLLNAQGREEFSIKDKRFTPELLDLPWYGLKEQIELPKAVAALRPDLAHFPHFNAPYRSLTPYVITIHDTILFDHPSRRASTLSWPVYQAKHLLFKHHFKHVIAKAAAVLTVSKYAKSRVEHYAPSAVEKTSVTHIAPSPHLLSIKKEDDLGMRQPYLLYVGNAYPHKNLSFLLRAFHHLWMNRQYLQLVLVGKFDYFYWRLKEEAAGMDWHGKVCPVRFFGFATERQLASLYSQADLYVFPSLDEGFGLPPLEAMSLGIPVLSSRAASMPEVLGDAAVYFDPSSEADFCQKAQELLADNEQLVQMTARGRKQALHYSWRHCAEQTLAVYLDVLRKRQ